MDKNETDVIKIVKAVDNVIDKKGYKTDRAYGCLEGRISKPTYIAVMKYKLEQADEDDGWGTDEDEQGEKEHGEKELSEDEEIEKLKVLISWAFPGEDESSGEKEILYHYKN